MDVEAVRTLLDYATVSVRRSWASADLLEDTIAGMTAELLTMDIPVSFSRFHDPKDKAAAFVDLVTRLRSTNSLPRKTYEPDSDLDLQSAAGRSSRIYTDIMVAIRHRRLFWVDTGHFGMGPTITREGDIVAVFLGSIHPSVLRPVGNQYCLLGPAYIPGLMEGEVFHMELEETWIDLR